MKPFRSSLLLGVVGVLIVGYAYVFVFKKGKEDTEFKEKESLVLKSSQSEVRGLKITHKDSDFVIKREEGGWVIESPISDLGDDEKIDSFLESIFSEKSETSIGGEGEKPDWKLFGLEEPGGIIKLEFKNKTSTQVFVGSNALDGKVYLRKDQENMVLVGTSQWKRFIDKKLVDLRKKEVFRVEGLATEIEIKSKEAHVVLKKREGSWWLEKPVMVKADQESVTKYLNKLKDLKASEFLSETKKDAGKYKLKAPEFRVKLGLDDGKSWELLASKKDDNNWALLTSDLNSIFQVAKYDVDNVNKTANEFRNKKEPFAFDKSKVKKIGFRSSLIDVQLVKKEKDWVLEQSDPLKEVVQDQVSDLLDRLGRLEAKSFLGTKKGKGLDPPRKNIVLRDEAGGVLLNVNWGEKTAKDNEFFVKTNLMNETLTVASYSLSGLPEQTLIKDKEKKSKEADKETDKEIAKKDDKKET